MSNPQPQQDSIQMLINRTRGLIGLKRVRTVGHALEHLGIEDYLPDGLKREDPINVLSYNTKIVPAILELELMRKLYKHEDSLLETPIPPPGPPKDPIELYPIPARNPKQKATCLPFQLRAAKEMFYAIVAQEKRAVLLPAKVGHGKTFAYCQVVRWLVDSGWIAKNSISPWPIAIITKPSIVAQTEQVAYEEFGLSKDHVLVTTWPAMRSSFGKLFIDRTERHEFGEIVEEWVWRPFVYPAIIVADECQALKNEGSQQYRIIHSYNDIPNARTAIIGSSATPFSKVASARWFCVATRKTFAKHGRGFTLSNRTWGQYASTISTRGDPHIFSKASMRRLLRDFKEYIVTFRNVHEPFHSHNDVIMLDFENKADETRYFNAWEMYLKRKREIEGQDLRYGFFLILAQLTVFRVTAEGIRAYALARDGYKDVEQNNLTAIYACAYKPTIAKAVVHLTQDFNVPRDRISLIWGGSKDFDSGGVGEFDSTEIQDILAAAMRGEEVDEKKIREISRQLKMGDYGLASVPQGLELGPQDIRARNREIDKLMSGYARYCFFTYGAGGAGLSLHHQDEKNRPRRTRATPTYNEMELEQAFGRSHRITSISDTHQSIMLYRGTVEIDVLKRQNLKRFGMEQVMKFPGGWVDPKYAEEIVKASKTSSDEGFDEDEYNQELKEVYEEDIEEVGEEKGDEN